MGVRSIIDTNKISKQNPGDLYRPPALRNQANEAAIKNNVTVNEEMMVLNESSSNRLTNMSTLQSISYSTLSVTTTTTSMSCSNSPMHRCENTNINNSTTSTQRMTYKTQQQQYVVDEQQKQLSQQPQQQVRRERRPDRAVYIPRARRSQTTPPNTSSPSQTQPSPQQKALSTQLPAIAPIPSSNTSKSLSQQLAITSNDIIAALVKQKPSAKADELSKTNIISNSSTHENIQTTITKKKEKLNKEIKDLREQRREQRLVKNLSTQPIRSISDTYEKPNQEDCLYTILNNEGILDNNSKNQESIVNYQQIHTTPEVNGVNDNINLSKGFYCDDCEQLKVNKELLDTNVQNCSCLNLIQQESNENANIDKSALNDFEISKECINSPESNTRSNITTSKNIITTNIFVSSSNNKNTMSKTTNQHKTNKLSSELYNANKMTNLRIEDIESRKCDIEEQELQRASKEINRSNRRIFKQTFVSDVLQIPDSIDEEKSEGKSKMSIVSETFTNVPALKAHLDNNTDEEEEDDWENMYNESGDCLDPKIMQELTASVGKCKIELPKMDYSAYLTKQSILNEEEFPHVLEVSNFPVEFKNQDLLMVFSQYKESGFDIKWVDDTHALAVFSSSRIAAEVLTMGHPFVVLKPLAEATIESRLKAKKCAASLQPYRPRPETCAALARRLVTGALGVRLKTAAAERENEKRVLREAKERKLLAAKQRDEVWES